MDFRNRKHALEDALDAVKHLAQGPLPNTLDFAAIANEIDGGRPVCCHIAWDPANPDDGHFNVIVGYDFSNQDIDVCDCLGDSTLPYTTFLTAYQGKGSWDITYLTH